MEPLFQLVCMVAAVISTAALVVIAWSSFWTWQVEKLRLSGCQVRRSLLTSDPLRHCAFEGEYDGSQRSVRGHSFLATVWRTNLALSRSSRRLRQRHRADRIRSHALTASPKVGDSAEQT